jgi:hypothetical protein
MVLATGRERNGQQAPTHPNKCFGGLFDCTSISEDAICEQDDCPPSIRPAVTLE